VLKLLPIAHLTFLAAIGRCGASGAPHQKVGGYNLDTVVAYGIDVPKDEGCWIVHAEQRQPIFGDPNVRVRDRDSLADRKDILQDFIRGVWRYIVVYSKSLYSASIIH